MNYGGVPSLYGGMGYGGYGGYGGGFGYGTNMSYPGMVSGIQSQSGFQPVPPQPPASAAVPTTTFGLPKQQENDNLRTTTFEPPPNAYKNESPPTVRDGSLGSSPYDHARTAGSYSLEDVENPRSTFYDGGLNDAETQRNQMLVDEAQRVGERAGYASEVVRLNRNILTYGNDLDRRFNFDRLRNGYVMPPVISQVDTTSERCGVNCIYLTTGAYRIVQEAYVTDRSPTWRNYLLLDPPSVQLPAGLKVKSKDRGLWKRTVDSAWKRGVEHARNSFNERFAMLNRDYAGMGRYYDLERQGAVSMSRVAVESRNGVIYVNGKSAARNEMRIGIAVEPRFQNPGAIATAYTSSADRP